MSSLIFSQEKSIEAFDDQIKLLLYSSSGIVSLIMSVIFHIKLSSRQNQYQKLIKSDTITIDELYEHLVKQLNYERQNKINNFRQPSKLFKYVKSSLQLFIDIFSPIQYTFNNNNQNSKKKKRIYTFKEDFFIQGVVAKGKYTQSFPSIESNKEVVYSKITTDNIYMEFDGKNGHKEQKINVDNQVRSTNGFEIIRFPKKNASKFQEFSTLKNECCCLVTNYKNTNLTKALTHIDTNEKVYQKFKFGNTLVAGSLVNIGIIKNQIGIKIGDPLLICGKVVWDYDRNIFKIDKPEYFVKTKQQLKEILELKISYTKIGFYVFTLIGLYSAAKIVNHLFFKKRPDQNNNGSNHNSYYRIRRTQ